MVDSPPTCAPKQCQDFENFKVALLMPMRILIICKETISSRRILRTALCTHAAGDAMAVVEQGSARRRTNETRMNQESSRSHAVLMVYIESWSRADSDVECIRSSRLNLIDLAGAQAAAMISTQRSLPYLGLPTVAIFIF